MLTPVRAPNANAVAEGVIGTLRRECLDYFIIVNERHLREVLLEYVGHYNGTRPHRTAGSLGRGLSSQRTSEDGRCSAGFSTTTIGPHEVLSSHVVEMARRRLGS